MALFKILKGVANNLGKSSNETGKSTDTSTTKEGYAYFTPDDGKFYIDVTSNEAPLVGEKQVDGANRICINSVSESEADAKIAVSANTLNTTIQDTKTSLESSIASVQTYAETKSDDFTILNCGNASTT